VKPGEEVPDAVFRGLHETVGVRRGGLVVRRICHIGQAPYIDPERKGLIGEALYFFHVTCDREPRVELNTDNWGRFQWFSSQEAIDIGESFGARRDTRSKHMSASMRAALQATSVA